MNVNRLVGSGTSYIAKDGEDYINVRKQEIKISLMWAIPCIIVFFIIRRLLDCLNGY